MNYDVLRRLDAEIAEKVMDERNHIDNGEGFCENCHEEMLEWKLMRFRQQGGNEPKETPCVPEYSSDLIAAMAVVEKMRESFEVDLSTGPMGGWYVRLRDGNPLHTVGAGGPDLPDCVCRAALSGVGVLNGTTT